MSLRVEDVYCFSQSAVHRVQLVRTSSGTPVLSQLFGNEQGFFVVSAARPNAVRISPAQILNFLLFLLALAAAAKGAPDRFLARNRESRMGWRTALTVRVRRRASASPPGKTTPSLCCRSDPVYAVDWIGPAGFGWWPRISGAAAWQSSVGLFACGRSPSRADCGALRNLSVLPWHLGRAA